jgi:hypothetical protein
VTPREAIRNALRSALARETESYTVLREPEGNEFCVLDR